MLGSEARMCRERSARVLRRVLRAPADIGQVMEPDHWIRRSRLRLSQRRIIFESLKMKLVGRRLIEATTCRWIPTDRQAEPVLLARIPPEERGKASSVGCSATITTATSRTAF
jgi:hypothetical protein